MKSSGGAAPPLRTNKFTSFAHCKALRELSCRGLGMQTEPAQYWEVAHVARGEGREACTRSRDKLAQVGTDDRRCPLDCFQVVRSSLGHFSLTDLRYISHPSIWTLLLLAHRSSSSFAGTACSLINEPAIFVASPLHPRPSPLLLLPVLHLPFYLARSSPLFVPAWRSAGPALHCAAHDRLEKPRHVLFGLIALAGRLSNRRRNNPNPPAPRLATPLLASLNTRLGLGPGIGSES